MKVINLNNTKFQLISSKNCGFLVLRHEIIEQNKAKRSSTVKQNITTAAAGVSRHGSMVRKIKYGLK